MLEKKEIEKDRFSGPKGLTSRGSGQPIGEPVDQLPLSGRGLVEECQKHSLSSSSFLFPVEVHPFPVEATVTYQALNAPPASEPINP